MDSPNWIAVRYSEDTETREKIARKNTKFLQGKYQKQRGKKKRKTLKIMKRSFLIIIGSKQITTRSGIDRVCRIIRRISVHLGAGMHITTVEFKPRLHDPNGTRGVINQETRISRAPIQYSASANEISARWIVNYDTTHDNWYFTSTIKNAFYIENKYLYY